MTDTDCVRSDLRRRLIETRARTLRLLSRVPDDVLKLRVHDFYSPIGWHVGHIGRTEELWVCENGIGSPPLDDRLSRLFVNVPENPKEERVHLPDRSDLIAYLDETRQRTLTALDTTDLGDGNPLLRGGYAWEFARLHECQHQETIAELLQLIARARPAFAPLASVFSFRLPRTPVPITDLVPITGGTFRQGSDDPFSYDNEQSAHPVTVAPFALERTPVTSRQWAAFLDDGGYRRPELWTAAGWAWRERERATSPEYWLPAPDDSGFAYAGPNGPRAIDPEEPVSGIGWYEADAYARWAGRRLPTEAEWEFAAAFDPASGATRRFPWGDSNAEEIAPADFGLSGAGPKPVGSSSQGASALGLLDMAGGVWEWTASPFLPYDGFEAYPYDGYSKDHMDGQHYVCKGGSWATAPDIARCAFRNWYVPGYRQGFLGLRCAQ